MPFLPPNWQCQSTDGKTVILGDTWIWLTITSTELKSTGEPRVISGAGAWHAPLPPWPCPQTSWRPGYCEPQCPSVCWLPLCLLAHWGGRRLGSELTWPQHTVIGDRITPVIKQHTRASTHAACLNISGFLSLINHSTHTHTHTHTHPFNGPFSGTTGWAGTRKVKPIWILLKQETVSGSGISWAICKSASHSRQITMPVPYHSNHSTHVYTQNENNANSLCSEK